MKRRLILLAAACSLPAQQAALARRPYLQNVQPRSAVVMWTTTGSAGSGVVRYGEMSASSTVRAFAPESTGLPETIYQHRALLTGLEPGQRYRYRVFIDGGEVLARETLEFSTPAPGAFEFLVFGDSGDGGHPQRLLAEPMFAEQPALVLHTGDIAYYEGTFDAFERFYFDVYWPLMRRVPFFPTPGNHDYVFDNGSPFVAVHDLPADGVPAAGRGRYYSFDWGNVHFTALDSNTPMLEALDGGNPAILRWLEADLESARRPFRVVYFHHTVFPTANYRGNEYCERLNAALTGMLERHGVQLVLTGHEHLYQRTKVHRHGAFGAGNGTVYVTTGGAGSNLYAPEEASFLDAGSGLAHYLRVRVDAAAMVVEAVAADGSVFDRFTLSPAPAAEGIVDAAAGRPLLAPGGLAALYGWTLANGTAAAQRFPLPRELAGVSVKVGGFPAPLLFASPGQINFQLPYALAAGRTTVSVTHDGLTSSLPVMVQPTAPAIFQLGVGRAAVLHGDGAMISPAAPAVPGEWLSVYLTGLGSVPGAVEGEAASLARVTTAPRVELEGAVCDVAYAGLAPGFAGVYQINWRVPPAARAGVFTLRIGEGASTAAAAIPVRAP